MKYTKKQKTKVKRVMSEIKEAFVSNHLLEYELRKLPCIWISLNDKHCGDYVRRDDVVKLLNKTNE